MELAPVVRHAVIALFSGVVAMGYAPAAKSLVISGSSLAFGESVGLTGALTLTSGPTPVASGTAPPPYANSDLLASATVGATLTTDLLEVNASSDVDGSPGPKSAAAIANFNGLSISVPNEALGLSLTFSASFISSSASVSGDFGALIASVSMSIEAAALTIGGVGIEVGLSPAPNTLAFSGFGLEVFLNEQIVSGDGIGSRGLEVNAIRISFDNFPLESGVLDGDIIISHSEAELIAIPGQDGRIPEPATLLLLAGGLVGLGYARRKIA